MAEGLLQMLGGGQQAQQQQQGNLLGGFFQSESQARRQGRERLLGQALQIAQQQDPIRSGFAVAGGLLGEGIGRAMGRVTPEEARQQKFAGLQTQLMQEGLDPTQDPAGFYTRLAELLQNQGDMQTALRAAAKAREFAPEPVEMEPATFYNLNTGEYVQGAYANGTPVNPRTGAPLPTNVVERDYEEGAAKKGKARNVRLPNGEFIRGIERPDGTVVDTQGRVLPEEATIVGLSLQAQDQEGLPQGVQEQLNTRQLGVENYTDLVNETIGIFNENPSVNSLAAEGSRLLREVRAEFDSFLDLTGVDLAEGITQTSLLDPSNYDSTFEEIGLENAALKPLYLSLALQQAQTEAGQSGRALSDRDVVMFLKQQGNNYSDPEVATEILRRNARRLQRSFKKEYEIRTDSDFTQEFPPIREYSPSTRSERSGTSQEREGSRTDGQEQLNISSMSAVELRQLNLEDLSDEQIQQFLDRTNELGE